MTYRTRTKSQPDRQAPFSRRYDGVMGYQWVGPYANTITYQLGPQWVDGHVNWKECKHSTIGTPDPTGHALLRFNAPGARGLAVQYAPTVSPPGVEPPTVSSDMISEACEKITNQFDLNCHDKVLLYSGVLQAIPLVGGAFKFVSIMNRAAKRLSKSFRKKPFTTVVKTMIQGDFINRFVVKPTIDDARKFLDAHNYVMRTLNTMQSRNVGYTALEGAAEEILSQKTTSGTSSLSLCRLHYTDQTEVSAKIQLKALCEVNYNLDAFDPIKLWAARVGLTSPLDSAWDLIPFSFVIDYFTRAGEFISGLSDEMSNQGALYGKLGSVRGLWACSTCKATCKRVLTSATLFNPAVTALLNLDKTPQESGITIFNRYALPPHTLYNGLLATDRGIIHCDLTLTRSRTLAELFIQAKLR